MGFESEVFADRMPFPVAKRTVSKCWRQDYS